MALVIAAETANSKEEGKCQARARIAYLSRRSPLKTRVAEAMDCAGVPSVPENRLAVCGSATLSCFAKSKGSGEIQVKIDSRLQPQRELDLS